MKTLLSALLFLLTLSHTEAQPKSFIVLLGTGNPNANPEKYGPAVAVVVNDVPYLFDCGAGVVRRAAKAFNQGVKGLAVANLDKVFITHLHSDHTLGLPDVYLTPAVLERKGPFNLYGPKGTSKMMNSIHDAYAEDIELRTEGLEHGNKAAYEFKVIEVDDQFVYKDANVAVQAIPVNHGSWKYAYGYKITTADNKVIVISGDCTFSETIKQASKGADVLIHEVYSMEGLAQRTENWQKYHSTFHTSTAQLADIANYAKPEKLVLIHQLVWRSTEEQMVDELKSRYNGVIINGKDLDVIEVE